MSKIKAPWKDFNGNPIHEGDTIQHPNGYFGIAVIDHLRAPIWRVLFSNGDNITLVQCVAEKGCVIVEQAVRADQFSKEAIAKFQALNFPPLEINKIRAVETPCPAGLTPHLRQYLHNDGSGIVFGYDKAGVDSLVTALNDQVRHLRAAIIPPNIYDTAAWRAYPMKHVLAIGALIDPPPMVVDGKTMVFRNPMAAEALTEISKEYRAMLDTVPPAPDEAPAAAPHPTQQAGDVAIDKLIPLFDGKVDIPEAIAEIDHYMYLRGYHDAASKVIAITEPIARGRKA